MQRKWKVYSLKLCIVHYYFIVFSSNPVAATFWNVTGFDFEAIRSFVTGFYAVNWTPEAKEDFQNTILSGPTGTYCASVASDVSCIDQVHSPHFQAFIIFYRVLVGIMRHFQVDLLYIGKSFHINRNFTP